MKAETTYRQLSAQELDDFAWAINHYTADVALDGHPKRGTARVERLRALESLLANALVEEAR